MSDPQRIDLATRRAELLAQRRALDESVDKVISITDAKVRRNRDSESRREGFRQRQAEVVERSSAICHDMLLTRSQDEWSLAFGFLVNHSLANLGLANAAADDNAIGAMIFNLSGLAAEMEKAFPDRRMAVDPWRRAIAALGEPNEPRYDSKPHPHVESLSRLVLTLRDTGPSLKEFRVYYAPFGSTMHIVRPA